MPKRIPLALAAVVLVAASLGFASTRDKDYAWELTPTGSTARLRGVSAVSAKIAWASGYEGTVLRTLDRGASWQSVGPPGASALQFRDIEAFDADNAVILSIGPGSDSRVYVTADGGAHWTQTFTNAEPTAFYDCITFFDRRHGLAASDPVGGVFRLAATDDGGLSWHVIHPEMPPALPSEYMFAASGQCLVSEGPKHAWFGTGGDAVARVFRTDDRGATWKVSATPVRSSPSAGIFALAFRDARHGLAIGGDFAVPDSAPDGLALTFSGGANWQGVPDADAPNEYRSGAAWVNGTDAIAVGPTGSDVSFNRGADWREFDGGSFDTVDCANASACWAAGEQGRAAHLTTRR